MSRNTRPEPGHEMPTARYWRQARKGKAYVVSERFTVAPGGNFNMHFKNPSSTNKTAVFQEIPLGSQFQGTLDVHDGFSSAPSGGTPLAIENQIMDSAGAVDSGDMEANKNVTYTADNTHEKKAFGGGPGGKQGIVNGPKVFSIENGREIVVDVTNESGTESKASLSMRYFVIDTQITNEL